LLDSGEYLYLETGKSLSFSAQKQAKIKCLSESKIELLVLKSERGICSIQFVVLKLLLIKNLNYKS
jgi:hypothetical protein